MSQERRCPSCGALVSADAEWCGQCYTRLDAGRTSTAVREAQARGLEVVDGRTTWVCPSCEHRNPIEQDRCAVCGTAFARLFEEPEAPPALDPQAAAVWSMVLPGLGHWRLGRRGDAIARFAVFGWAFGALSVLLVSRFGTGGLGPTFPLFALFASAALAIYVLSAVDAYRIAAGDEPIVSSRVLLWSSVALIVLSIVVATFVTIPAARR